MGAALAFEVALRLQKAGRGITTLYVSGRLPPHKNTNTDFYRQSDVSILNKITQLGGSTLDYQQPELKDLLLPIFRADFTAIETYQRQCTELLNCSVMACVGEQDTEVSVRQMSEWCQVTKGAFRLQVFPGGHFYLNHAQKDYWHSSTSLLPRSNQARNARSITMKYNANITSYLGCPVIWIVQSIWIVLRARCPPRVGYLCPTGNFTILGGRYAADWFGGAEYAALGVKMLWASFIENHKPWFFRGLPTGLAWIQFCKVCSLIAMTLLWFLRQRHMYWRCYYWSR